jgi:hypothetical protein
MKYLFTTVSGQFMLCSSDTCMYSFLCTATCVIFLHCLYQVITKCDEGCMGGDRVGGWQVDTRIWRKQLTDLWVSASVHTEPP